MEGKQGKEAMEAMEEEPEAMDHQELVSSDDEIDYSIKPEFYDPNLDEKDEVWVCKQRKGHGSDAVLSCPACFTTLCLDCQRHEKYLTQYRAMFVMNCKIKMDKILPQEKQKPRKSKSDTKTGSKLRGNTETDEIYHPVCCSVCSIEVGVFDENEIYHFFNVLPSYS
ncbi:E2F-associated phosphoprotein [Dioscorea alata]|uniref:E2F-associated phosphoprotein n=1 Tax=Dioscorea alata TaxID=55571 RepID=A0ACB7UQU2_DIOAL|nr:E2F-associated phosphoprotein [Dioscorea alata]